MAQEVQQENKMGILPVPKLLFQMALPVIISMLIQALYNVVDSMFVAKINENALTAVSLVFPVQNLLIAISAGTGVGINSLLSRSLGAKEFKRANDAALNGIFLALISSVIFAVVGVLAAGPFFSFQTTDPEIHKYGVQYMTVICALCVGVFMQITFERLLQSTGKTLFTMISQGTGAIINIIFDPILIFGLFGFPEMGVIGAAVATVAGQIFGMFLGLFFNLKFNHELRLSLRGFRPRLSIIKGIYAVGVPSIIMQAIGSVMTFGMNKILMQFTSTAAAVFGVYFKLNSFVFMPIFGLNNAMVPIVAYNYGARQRKRIMHTIRLSIITAVCFMLVGIACFVFIPDVLLGIFEASENMLAIGVPALRTICISFVFAGPCIILSSVFQALGNGLYSLWISFARQLVVILPAAYILAQCFGLAAVWWSIPLAELVSISLTLLLFQRIYRQKLANL
ncbi:MAG TPA: MATE family efflux transporter [Candidatus Egerieimonas intestinavium]|uniref:Probable multidrug resistance protein NorM n=1 Tax=Candidatus Egerieimonas intestinavium TaxID=2840777 RepID=A0A9D1JGD8_9FIRM|nr:MATE family efflux transporter [Candidatus Egerieimonas intestinavium]